MLLAFPGRHQPVAAEACTRAAACHLVMHACDVRKTATAAGIAYTDDTGGGDPQVTPVGRSAKYC